MNSGLGVVWTGSEYIACGSMSSGSLSNAVLAASQDGQKWNILTSSILSQFSTFNSIAVSPNSVIVCGQPISPTVGTVLVSTNLLNWTIVDIASPLFIVPFFSRD